MQNIGEVEELREIMFESIDILIDAGYKSPIGKHSWKINYVVCLHYGLLIVKAELNQLHSGLMHNSGQLMESVREYRNEFQFVFHGGKVAFIAGIYSVLSLILHSSI